MEYRKRFVYELMDKGGPTKVTEPYFMEAAEEMMRARTLCAKANAVLPDDLSYVGYLEELFDRKLDDVRILTPFICDFGNRVTFGKNVFINHSAILSTSGGIEFEDGVMAAPGLRIATINHDMYDRHITYTYGKVHINQNHPLNGWFVQPLEGDFAGVPPAAGGYRMFDNALQFQAAAHVRLFVFCLIILGTRERVDIFLER